jgi:hypothetical protein
MRNEQRSADARSLMWIGASAAVAVMLTGSFVTANVREAPARRVDVRVRYERPVPPRADFTPLPLTGAGRIYGRVSTRDGHDHVGFIRWDRNEGSWTDLLDANKESRGGTQSGIRFGHVQRIDVLGSSRADLLLRSGEVARMGARSTDLGTGLRALTVEDAAGGTVELAWRDLVTVEFFEAPPDAAPRAERLHGTLTTRDGRSFTGHIAWDVDEIYTSDVLDGDDVDGARQKIPFGSIASISRNGSGSAHIVLHTGGQMILDGTNDVDESISGITVSDPQLGEVKLGWDAFREVRFHPPEPGTEAVHFDGGGRLEGTVVTRSGEAFSGRVRWDDDEAFGWEILNGSSGDVELQVELGRVARIARVEDGATVQLEDGRTFDLTGSNDVDRGNRGVVVEGDHGTVRIDWRDFAELRLRP